MNDLNNNINNEINLRKDFVKSQRLKFKQNPSLFFKEEFIQPLIEEFKENWILSFFNFTWFAIKMFIICFLAGMLILNYVDCTSNNKEFNGTFFNVFFKYKNHQESLIGINNFDNNNDLICTQNYNRFWTDIKNIITQV